MQCPFLSASFHLHLTCHESLGSGNLTDITMDSTSKLGALTAWFLTSFSGRRSFSTQRTSCLVVSVCDKDGEKEGRAGRLQGQSHRRHGKQEDKETSFPRHFDMDTIKKAAGICLASSRDSANPCLLLGWDLQGEAGVLKFLKCIITEQAGSMQRNSMEL